MLLVYIYMEGTDMKNENFKRAINDLFGINLKIESDADEYDDGYVEENQYETETYYSYAEEEPEKTEEADKKEVAEEMRKAEVKKTEVIEEKEPPVVYEDAIVPYGMVTVGNVSVKSDIHIKGDIIGDVECEGKIFLSGSIKGNVRTGSICIQQGSLEGDLSVTNDVGIERDSVVKGNISAANMISDSDIYGQIQLTGTLELGEDACVEGDIKVGAMIMRSGAKIKGMVDVEK